MVTEEIVIDTLPTARPLEPLATLIAEVRQFVATEHDANQIGRAVAALLQPYLLIDGLLTLEQLQPDPTNYRQQILHIEPDGSFSIAALIWLPGQATPIHDHVSWCVVGVYKGTESETSYQLRGAETDAHLVPLEQTRNFAGSVAALVPPGDIHQVANKGDGVAVSLHVYGADLGALGCSIRRRYDLPVR